MASIIERIPRPDGNLYTTGKGDETEVVEKLWDSIKYVNDSGEVVHLVVFLNDEEELEATEEGVWANEFYKEQSPTYDLDIDYYNEEV